MLNYIGKPSLHLPFCMIIWGVISILTGEFKLIRFHFWPHADVSVNRHHEEVSRPHICRQESATDRAPKASSVHF